MNNSKKIVLAGHFGVGKSSLVARFVTNTFSEDYKVTIGVQILKKEVEVQNTKFNFLIWDIEGKETLSQMRQSYLIGTHAFIYVIDPLRASTYANLTDELEYIKTNFLKTPTIIVANKSDLIVKNNFDKILLDNNLKIDFYASAKTSENVQNIFEKMALKFLEL